jgi:putative MATE family efflux protein
VTEPTRPPPARLLAGAVPQALREQTVPMLVGMVAMILVNLVDTWWVSRLGTQALAAMTFAFPVEALVINVALGLMIGTSVAVSRAVGAGRPDEARLLTTHTTLLAAGVVAAVSGLGLGLQRPLFRAMGAEGPLLDDVVAYMTPWFVGVAFLVVPMIANGALRALGDPRTPMRVMLAAALINAVLDPLLIFGLGPVPALGLQGASIATVIARFVTMVAVFAVLARRTPLLGLQGTTPATLRASWWAVGRVAGPAAVTNAVGPFAVGLLTALLSRHGPEALAAGGIGARLDAVLLLAPNALSGALSPFVGQNWGAHLRARVAEGLRRSLQFAIGWGALSAAALMLLAPQVAALFTEDPAVSAAVVLYLRVVPVGYAFVGAAAMCSATFNAVDRAPRSTAVAALRSLGFALPLAWAGDQLAGLQGLLLGTVLASIFAALLGVRWMRAYLWPLGERPPGAGPALGPEAVRQWLAASPGWADLAPATPELLGLEGVRAYEARPGRLSLHIGARELLHLDRAGRMSLPLPLEIGENLVRLGLISPHPDHEADGWYQHRAPGAAHPGATAWLIGLAHLLYALSQRGSADPLTQRELDTFTRTPQCVAAMKAAAARWDALPAAA